MNTTTRIHYLIHAYRARRYYKKDRAYTRNDLPCLSCVWEHEPQDTYTPWHWILCDRCDWGNC